MEFNRQSLSYPGVFAQIEHTGYVEVFERGSDNDKSFCVRGMLPNGERFDKDYLSLEEILNEHPYLRDAQFVRRKDGDLQVTRQLQGVIDSLMSSEYAWCVGDIRVCLFDASKIDSIKLTFPPNVWSDLVNKEGTLLPMCCASISSIRDQFIDALREDGWMSAEDMQTVVVNKSSHSFDKHHPVGVVDGIFSIIEKHVNLREISTENPLDPVDACSMIYHFAGEFSWSKISSDFESFRNRACLSRNIFNVIPALVTLYNRIRQLDLGPVEGYALIDRTNGEIYEMSRGIAVFPTFEEAKGIAEHWIRSEQIKAGHLDIKAVRVSAKNGIEFIDSVNNPFVDPNRMVPELNSGDQEVAEEICKELAKYENKVEHEKVKIALRIAQREIEKIKSRRNPQEAVEF